MTKGRRSVPSLSIKLWLLLAIIQFSFLESSNAFAIDKLDIVFIDEAFVVDVAAQYILDETAVTIQPFRVDWVGAK